MQNIPQPLNLDQSVRLWEMSLFSFQGRRFGGSAPRARLGQGVLGPQVAQKLEAAEETAVGSRPLLVSCPCPLARCDSLHSALFKSSHYVQQHVSREFRLTRSCPMGQSV